MPNELGSLVCPFCIPCILWLAIIVLFLYTYGTITQWQWYRIHTKPECSYVVNIMNTEMIGCNRLVQLYDACCRSKYSDQLKYNVLKDPFQAVYGGHILIAHHVTMSQWLCWSHYSPKNLDHKNECTVLALFSTTLHIFVPLKSTRVEFSDV